MILTLCASKIQGDLAGNIYDVDVSSIGIFLSELTSLELENHETRVLPIDDWRKSNSDSFVPANKIKAIGIKGFFKKHSVELTFKCLEKKLYITSDSIDTVNEIAAILAQ